MRLFFFIIANSFLITYGYSQNIEAVNSSSIIDIIRSSEKTTVIHFWVPSCTNKVQVVKDLSEVHMKHGQDFQFVFIAITGRDSMLNSAYKLGNGAFDLYKIDTSQYKNLNLAIPEFGKDLSKKIGFKKSNFLVLAVNTELHVLLLNKKSKIQPSTIRKLRRKDN